MTSEVKYTDAYINRGVGYGKIGKYENEINDYETVLTIEPNNTRAREYMEATWKEIEQKKLQRKDHDSKR